MSDFSFLKEFEKEIKDLKSVGGDVEIGRYWISYGNFVLNRVMSGEFTKGLAQGTGSLIAGFSGCLPAGEKVRVYKTRTIDYRAATYHEGDTPVVANPYSDKPSLTLSMMLAELQAFGDVPKLEGATTNQSISEATSDHITSLFNAHCEAHSLEVQVEELSTHSTDQALLVSTPDGYQMIVSHWIKLPRPIVTVFAGSHVLRCSDNHLIETTDGWVAAGNLTRKLSVLTVSGPEPVLSTTVAAEEVVYDFEVGHPNHRYWSHGISSHNTGKSFIAGNVIREAQQAGAFNLIIDSENALDSDYLEKVGVDYTHGILRKRVVKITDAWTLIRSFLDGYIKEYGDKLSTAPKVHITIDSLGFMMTDSDYNNAEAGDFKADQGATKRMIKDLLKKLTHAVAGMNITYLCTDQVYQARAEQIMAGTAINGAVLNEQVKFAFHQIMYLSRLKLKDDKTKLVTGIRLKIAAAKTRFTQPFGQIELEVPYSTGIDPYNGLLEVAVALGVVEKRGARYAISGEEKTWYAKDFAERQEDVLIKCDALKDASIQVDTGLETDNGEAPKPFANQKRLATELLED